MNYLSVEELTENLVILLDVSLSAATGDELVQFPSEEEIFDIIKSKDQVNDIELEEREEKEPDQEKGSFKACKPLVVIWDDSDGKRYWCIGLFICQVDDDTVKVEHLKQQKKGGIQHWIHPESDDVQVVNLVQLLPIGVVGDWNFSNERHPLFNIVNATGIASVLKHYID